MMLFCNGDSKQVAMVDNLVCHRDVVCPSLRTFAASYGHHPPADHCAACGQLFLFDLADQHHLVYVCWKEDVCIHSYFTTTNHIDLEEGVKAAGFTTLHTRGAVYLAGCIICSVISGAFFIMLGSGRSASLERIYHGVGDDTAAPAKGDDLTKGGKDSAAAVVEHNVVESAV